MVPDDINLGRRYILLPHTKNGHTRRVPITNRLMSSCFDGQDLKDHPLCSVTADGIKSSFKRARVRAGLPSIRFHDLRHEAISRLFEKGLSVPEVSSISGHRDYAFLQRYAHADFERIQRILNAGM